MSQIPVTLRTSPPSAWKMYRAMVGVGLLCGLLIVLVFQTTKPVIEENKRRALEAAIFEVLPGAERRTTFALRDDGGFEPVEGEPAPGVPRVYGGFDGQGHLVGVAAEAQGMGYQDVIGLIYGYSPADDAIIGVYVLESKETPGLGDRIESDPQFRANFERLDVTPSPDGEALAHAIVSVKHGTKQNPWEVDAITGATISSVAVANILDQSASFWVPRIKRRLGDLEKAD